jgi:hypothetical protein
VDLDALRKDVAGFKGHFVFEPAHDVPDRIGTDDYRTCDDRLVFVSAAPDHEGEVYVIAESISRHIAEPIARMLNAVPALLALTGSK